MDRKLEPSVPQKAKILCDSSHLSQYFFIAHAEQLEIYKRLKKSSGSLMAHK
jgi:hypothetical protein